ncbi:11364_t:CDS:2 [Diversispora eburnea]|uniref:11364_t:CDS:1 n=1 Tax=Diversispora eburnea TaxID=1213867 RepID=A0A9N8YK51_9GLOM|nr:11364_t:CDS:2 [Diversispora eburnea]
MILNFSGHTTTPCQSLSHEKEIKVSVSPAPQPKKTLPENPKNDRSHIINKLLVQYLHISLRCSNRNCDQYDQYQ